MEGFSFEDVFAEKKQIHNYRYVDFRDIFYL
jgi:hypothetical protein